MIIFNKALDAESLEAFLRSQFPGRELYLCSGNDMDYERLQRETLWFEYERQQDLQTGFCFNLNPMLFVLSEAHYCASLEKLTYELAQHFDCAAFCEASRIQLTQGNPNYSLLFETGRVYLVSDGDWEETGQVIKMAELSYDWPAQALHAEAADLAASQLMIRLNTPLDAATLQAFLAHHFSGHTIHLWDAGQGAMPLHQNALNIELCNSDAMETGFKDYLLLHFMAGQGHLTQRHQTTENLAAALSHAFHCTSVCSAARRDPAPDPSADIKDAPWLMFKAGHVYWASADVYQNGWEFYPIVELTYDWPDYPQPNPAQKESR